MGLRERIIERRKNKQLGDKSEQEIWHTRKHRHKKFAGVGAALKFIIKNRFGAQACGSCLNTEAKMNTEGPDWCRTHVEELAQEIHENVTNLALLKKGGWIKVVEWLGYQTSGLHAHKSLIYDAINLYETTSNESSK